jgi:hypothetical protein
MATTYNAPYYLAFVEYLKNIGSVMTILEGDACMYL